MKKILFSFILFNFSILLASENTKEYIIQKLSLFNFNPLLIVLIIATLPIFEVRGAIPVGLLVFKLPLLKVIVISIIGNMLPIIIIIFFFDFLIKVFSKFKFSEKILTKVFDRCKAKNNLMLKYQELGLMLFVAIPLPITGAWTGSIIASIMKLKPLYSLIFILLGIVFASIIVSTIILLGYWGAILIALILAISCYKICIKKL